MNPKGCYDECVREYPSHNYAGQSAHATCFDHCNKVSGFEPTVAYPKMMQEVKMGLQGMQKEGFADHPQMMHALNKSADGGWNVENVEDWGETKKSWGNDALTNHFEKNPGVSGTSPGKTSVYYQHYHRDDYDFDDARTSPYVKEIMSKNMHIPAAKLTRRMYKPSGGTGTEHFKNSHSGGAFNYENTTFSPYIQEIYKKSAAKEGMMNLPPFTLAKSNWVTGTEGDSADLAVINSRAGEVFNNKLIMTDSEDLNACHAHCDELTDKGTPENAACHRDCRQNGAIEGFGNFEMNQQNMMILLVILAVVYYMYWM